MNRKLLTLACAAAFVLVACKKEEAPAPEAAPAEKIAGTDATAVAPTPVSSDQAPTFDQKGFAGTFSAGDTTLELKPDGTYAVAYGMDKSDGTWTPEAGDKNVRLDPNSKEAEDAVFAITSNDELTPLGADGQPAADKPALKRAGAAAPAQ